ncbi:hypothetical protein N9118_11265 [Akkermansiaceae bacterium]|nr:hypothetical protein [Akkermansiaceae bacterium]
MRPASPPPPPFDMEAWEAAVVNLLMENAHVAGGTELSEVAVLVAVRIAGKGKEELEAP